MSFDINLTTKRSRAEVKALSNRIEQLSRVADSASGRLQAALGGGLGGTAQLKRIETAIGGINRNLINMSNQWQRTNTVAATSTRRMAQGVANVRATTRAGRISNEAYGNSLLTVSQKAAILRSGMLALGTHVGIFSATTLVAATVTFGLVKAMKAVVTVGAEYTRALTTTAAIIGVTRNELADLSREQLHLAETTKFTTTEVANASTILAKTGLKTAQVATALPSVLNLAAVGAVDMSKAADIAASALFGFQLEAKDLARVTDVLAFTAINSNSTIQQLGSSLSFAAPLARAAGAEIEDVAAILGVMANAGVKASKAGTSVRRAYVNLIGPTAEAAAVLKDLGIVTRDQATGQLRGLIDILEDFARNNGNVQDLEKIFGVRALAGIIPVWKSLAVGVAGGTSRLKELRKELNNVIGTAEKTREAMEENLIDVWLKFKSVVSVKATEAFLLIEDSLISLIKAMTRFTKEGLQVGETFRAIAFHARQWGDLISDMTPNILKLAFNTEGANRALGFHVGILKSITGVVVNLPAHIRFMATTMDVGFAKLMLLNKTFVLGLEGAWIDFKFFLKGLIGGLPSIFLQSFSEIFNGLARKLEAASKLLRDFKLAGADTLSDLAESLRGKADFLQAAPDRRATQLAAEEAAANAPLEARALILDRLSQKQDKILEAAKAAHVVALGRAAAEEKEFQAVQERFARQARNIAENKNLAADAAAGVDPGIGRLGIAKPATDILKSSQRELKNFIKLQNQSTAATVDQIQHLQKMKQIGPFEALSAGLQKSKNSLAEIQDKFNSLIGPLEKYRDLNLVVGREQKAEAEKYVKAIEKVTQTYNEQTATVKNSVREQTQALDLLRSQFETVSSAQGDFIQRRQQPLDAVGGIDFLGSLRRDAESGVEKINREEAEKLAALDQAYQFEVSLRDGQQAQALASEQIFQDMKTQIQDQAARDRLNLSVGHFQTEARAEQSFQVARASAIAGGFAALTQAGAASSKKLFELNKKARIAQILIDTPAAVSGAFSWGAAQGGIYTAIASGAAALLNQVALLNQARSATFGGGGSGAASTAATPTSTTPAAPDIPSATDSIFNQTNTGGTLNTVDSSQSRDSAPATVVLKIDVADAQGFDRMLERNKGKLTRVIQEAYTERGVRGGPIS